MKERISELKTKMLNIFQQGALRKKQEGKKHKKSSSVNQPIGVGSIFAKILRGIKVTFNTLFILGFIGGLFGAGLAIGYGVALFDKAKVPQAEELLKQVKNVSSISEIVYADGSVIASIESDLLRTSVSSEEISDTLKNAIVSTEDEHFL